jgi:hypothetical protein
MLALLCLFSEAIAAGSNSSGKTATRSNQTLTYSMSGRVRFLLFWLGRESVGRGKVTFEKLGLPELSKVEEKVTVLFGTLPERVPWRINRWGYGEEIGIWSAAESGAVYTLAYSVFTGFMRHSPEESISQISSSRARQENENQYWYDGIVSLVKPEEACTAVFYFPLVEEVTLDRMEETLRAFHARRDSGPADKSKTLSNKPSQYDSPQGFLLCLKRMLQEICKDIKNGPTRRDEGQPQKRSRYVYNARLYTLKLDRLKMHKTFRFDAADSVKASGLSAGSFDDVAEAALQIHSNSTGERHNFHCWFPVEGSLAGIPIQIQDNPRWWLQVRLRLVNVENN